MVDDDAPFRLFNQGRRDGHVRPVGINDEQQGLAVAQLFRRFRRNEQVLKGRHVEYLRFQTADASVCLLMTMWTGLPMMRAM